MIVNSDWGEAETAGLLAENWGEAETAGLLAEN